VPPVKLPEVVRNPELEAPQAAEVAAHLVQVAPRQTNRSPPKVAEADRVHAVCMQNFSDHEVTGTIPTLD
jgi:hypothetical protein